MKRYGIAGQQQVQYSVDVAGDAGWRCARASDVHQSDFEVLREHTIPEVRILLGGTSLKGVAKL
jgi:hypothetical protein